MSGGGFDIKFLRAFVELVAQPRHRIESEILATAEKCSRDGGRSDAPILEVCCGRKQTAIRRNQQGFWRARFGSVDAN